MFSCVCGPSNCKSVGVNSRICDCFCSDGSGRQGSCTEGRCGAGTAPCVHHFPKLGMVREREKPAISKWKSVVGESTWFVGQLCVSGAVLPEQYILFASLCCACHLQLEHMVMDPEFAHSSQNRINVIFSLQGWFANQPSPPTSASSPLQFLSSPTPPKFLTVCPPPGSGKLWLIKAAWASSGARQNKSEDRLLPTLLH